MPEASAEETVLLRLARRAVEAAVRVQPPPLPPGELPAAWARPGGAFVTLHLRRRLRGCVGILQSTDPVAKTVIRMAKAAAQEDDRFLPVQAGELAALTIEISILTPLVKIHSPEEIRVGQDGVYIYKAGRSGVFLPQVAREMGWDRETLLAALCREKAGLAGDAWKQGDCELYTFQSRVFSEA